MRLGEVAYWDGREERERESYPKERALGKSKKTENRQLNREPERLNRLMKLKVEKKKKKQKTN